MSIIGALQPAEREPAQRLLAAWQQAGLPGHAIQLMEAPSDGAAALALADDDRVAGLIADAPLLQALRQRVAARAGAIVPLLVTHEASQQLARLAAEQTVTVNTAAAGGNAALLAGVDAP